MSLGKQSIKVTEKLIHATVEATLKSKTTTRNNRTSEMKELFSPSTTVVGVKLKTTLKDYYWSEMKYLIFPCSSYHRGSTDFRQNWNRYTKN